jgi:DNA replication protein DnaC
MTVEETIDKLIQLKLPHMAKALREQLDRATGSALTVEECVGLMVDLEWAERENRRTGRRIKDAKLGMQACLEDLSYDPTRNLDKAVMRALGTGGWVRAKQNVIIIGMTGTGKSYISAALAEAACRQGSEILTRASSQIDRTRVFTAPPGHIPECQRGSGVGRAGSGRGVVHPRS